MPREVPLRHSLLLRLLALSALVSVCSIAATAWLAARTATGAIRQEQGQALADDAKIYDALLGYAATHRSWSGVDATVRSLARETGHRVTLTDQSRTPIADSGPGADPLPASASATIDPLAVDAALAPAAATDRIDPRAVGPFLLPVNERAVLYAIATRTVECLHTRARIDADIVEEPNGRPRIEAPGVDATQATCPDGEPAPAPPWTGTRTEVAPPGLDAPTPTESRALAELNVLVNTCLARHQLPAVQLHLDRSWERSGPIDERSSLQDSRTITACIGGSRREQLAPYVAPAALLFVIVPGSRAPAGFDLSPSSWARIGGVTALVLLAALGVTVLSGIRLVRPLHALIGAARRMRDGDGSARVRVTGHDEIGRLAAMFNDMSVRRERLEELRRAMVSDVAHEMRTPVSNIRGWLEAAEDGVAAPDRELMSSLLEEALLLQHVIDDLQDLAAADAGELRLHRQPVDLADLLAQVRSASRAQADRAGVTLDVRVGDPPPLVADPVRLRQAIGNLVTNAVRHTPAGGTVAIDARSTGGQVVIAVADTGTGIDAEDLPRVFDRFWRAEKSRSRQTGGSGLGLSIVRKLAEAHGGTVSATSTAGQGSVFTLRLPTTGTPSEGTAAGGRGGSVRAIGQDARAQ